jgi:predicted ribosome quality control (RQC) complex YloA/Tae2 family protein
MELKLKENHDKIKIYREERFATISTSSRSSFKTPIITGKPAKVNEICYTRQS